MRCRLLQCDDLLREPAIFPAMILGSAAGPGTACGAFGDLLADLHDQIARFCTRLYPAQSSTHYGTGANQRSVRRKGYVQITISARKLRSS
jgi:hypothetical protein